MQALMHQTVGPERPPNGPEQPSIVHSLSTITAQGRGCPPRGGPSISGT